MTDQMIMGVSYDKGSSEMTVHFASGRDHVMKDVDADTFKSFMRSAIPPQAKSIQDAAAAGRQGDTMLAHINPKEASKASGTNPTTGLPEFFEPGPGGPGADASGWGGGYSGSSGGDGRSAGDSTYSQSSTLGPYAGSTPTTSAASPSLSTNVGSGQWTGSISVIPNPPVPTPPARPADLGAVPTPPTRPLDALSQPTSAGLPSLVGSPTPDLGTSPYGAISGLTGLTSAVPDLSFGAPISGTFPGQGPLTGYDPQAIQAQTPAEYSAALAKALDALKSTMGGLGNFSMPLGQAVDPRAAGLIKP
jgi:hypothetical protein